MNLDFSFVLLCDFAAFLPDIDWRMQHSWRFGNVHRKLLHNVWVMCILAVVIYLIFFNWTLTFGIIVGFISHLVADSFTIQGVYWFFPLGKKGGKYHLRGPFSINEEKPMKLKSKYAKRGDLQEISLTVLNGLNCESE